MARQAVLVHPESLMMSLCHNNAENVNAKLVFDAAREGDETALKVFRRYVKYLAQAINTIIAFLDPEVIVLGGGVSKAGDFLLDAVRSEVPQYLMFKTMPHPRIEIASLGAEAGIIGAAMLGK
jgi:glucokinase